LRKLLSILFASALALGTFAAVAEGATLGITSAPAEADPEACGPDRVIAQVNSDPSTPYSVPGPGTITQWQTLSSGATPDAPVTLVVLKPIGDSFSVVAADSRTIPNPAPTVSSFTLATPIAVFGGETFGLYTDSDVDVICYFNGGATPAGNNLAALGAATPPAPSQTLNRIIGDSPAGYTMNLAANFVPATPAPAEPPAPVTPQKKKRKCKKKKRSAEPAKKKCKKKKKR
jgi:hypothetical protein